MSSHKDKALADMRKEMSVSGPLTGYLAQMRTENPQGADGLEADLIKVFTSDEGLRVLKLFEKSILYRSIPDGSEDRALREANALRNHVLEIRRIVSHGG